MHTHSGYEMVIFKIQSMSDDIKMLHRIVTNYQDIINLDDDDDYFLEYDDAGNEWNLSDEKLQAEEELKKLLPEIKRMVKVFVEYFNDNYASKMLPCNRVADLREWVEDEILDDYLIFKSGETIRDLLGVSQEDAMEKTWVFTELEKVYDKIWRDLAKEVRKKMNYDSIYAGQEFISFISNPCADEFTKKFDLKIKKYFEEWIRVKTEINNNEGE